MKFRKIALAALAALSPMSSVQAASKPKVFVGASGVDQDATSCGLSSESLRTPVVLTLRQNGVDVVTDFTDPYVLLRIVVQPLSSGQCVWALTIQMVGGTAQMTSGAFTANNVGGPMHTVCDLVSTGVFPKGHTPTGLFGQVKGMTEQCLASLTY